MNASALASIVVPAALAAAAFAAGRFGRGRAERRRLDEAERQRETLVREEEALRAKLRDANEALKLRAEALQGVLNGSMELKAHLPLEAVLANVVRAAATSLGYGRVLLSLHDRAEGVLVPRAQVGLAQEWPSLERLRLPSDRVATSLPGAETVTPAPLASLPRDPDRPGPVSVPLVAAGQPVGLLELDDRRADARGDVDRVVLDLFASQAVNAIRLARAHETMRLGSLRDALTGVANHGRFQETLQREVTRHERSSERLVLLMVDLDDFKGVNDRHGHPVGDLVLKAVVARLVASVREMDTVARYGGEEFAIVLPQTDAASGLRVAERLRSAVCASPIPAGLPEPLRLTVSIGLAVCPDDAARKGALIECADQALYAAKRTGKNRVVRYAKAPASAESLLTERA